MPDILIRGIKKPERCFICPLKYNRGMNYYCTIKEMQGVDSCISKNTMSVVCPFSELPPHGDLIDMDKIHYTELYGGVEVTTANWIDSLPVVVPAERRDADA